MRRELKEADFAPASCLYALPENFPMRRELKAAGPRFPWRWNRLPENFPMRRELKVAARDLVLDGHDRCQRTSR